MKRRDFFEAFSFFYSWILTFRSLYFVKMKMISRNFLKCSVYIVFVPKIPGFCNDFNLFFSKICDRVTFDPLPKTQQNRRNGESLELSHYILDFEVKTYKEVKQQISVACGQVVRFLVSDLYPI